MKLKLLVVLLMLCEANVKLSNFYNFLNFNLQKLQTLFSIFQCHMKRFSCSSSGKTMIFYKCKIRLLSEFDYQLDLVAEAIRPADLFYVSKVEI